MIALHVHAGQHDWFSGLQDRLSDGEEFPPCAGHQLSKHLEAGSDVFVQ